MENNIRVINASGDVKFVTAHVANSDAMKKQGYWVEQVATPNVPQSKQVEAVAESEATEFVSLGGDSFESMTKPQIIEALKEKGANFSPLSKKEELLALLKSL